MTVLNVDLEVFEGGGGFRGGRQIAFLVGILEDLTWPFMVLVFEV
jgi:hypothetical protein